MYSGQSREVGRKLFFQLSAVLREVHYLKLMGYTGIPESALRMLDRDVTFRSYIANLNATINWYNRIRRTSRDVEYNLIQSELEEIDKLVQHGQNHLDWNSQGKSVFQLENEQRDVTGGKCKLQPGILLQICDFPVFTGKFQPKL